MVCQVDNKKLFETEQPYTVKCEACNLFCKIDKYRSCEARHEWHAAKGEDVFAPLAGLDRFAQIQQGQGDTPVHPTQANRRTDRSSPRSRHRGRK